MHICKRGDWFQSLFCCPFSCETASGCARAALSAFDESQTADDEQNAQEDDPGLGRQEERAHRHDAEDQEDEADILGLLVDVKAFLFAKIVVHALTPAIYYENK